MVTVVPVESLPACDLIGLWVIPVIDHWIIHVLRIATPWLCHTILLFLMPLIPRHTSRPMVIRLTQSVAVTA